MQCKAELVGGMNWICGNDVPEGSLAICESENIYYRTIYSLICLNKNGASFTGTCNPCPNNFKVRVLPKGSVVTLTQK